MTSFDSQLLISHGILFDLYLLRAQKLRDQNRSVSTPGVLLQVNGILRMPVSVDGLYAWDLEIRPESPTQVIEVTASDPVGRLVTS